jgi:hypothetical protein
MTADQIIILVTGCSSFWMIHSPDRKVRFSACVLAIIGQPFWFYAAYTSSQWGIFAIDFIATLGWARGLRNNWR